MDYLENVTVGELHDMLAKVDEKKPVQRILADIAYKDDVSQKTISERHDVHPNTVRNWLNRLERLEAEPVESSSTTIPAQVNHATSTKLNTNDLSKLSTNLPKMSGLTCGRGLFP